MTTADELRDFAREHMPDLARAAADGYDVTSGVLDAIASDLAAPFAEIATIVREGTQAHADLSWSERESPRAAALAIRDAVLARVELVARPTCVVVDISRVMRVEERTPGGAKEKFTAVIARIGAPGAAARVVVVRTE